MNVGDVEAGELAVEVADVRVDAGDEFALGGEEGVGRDWFGEVEGVEGSVGSETSLWRAPDVEIALEVALGVALIVRRREKAYLSAYAQIRQSTYNGVAELDTY